MQSHWFGGRVVLSEEALSKIKPTSEVIDSLLLSDENKIQGEGVASSRMTEPTQVALL